MMKAEEEEVCVCVYVCVCVFGAWSDPIIILTDKKSHPYQVASLNLNFIKVGYD